MSDYRPDRWLVVKITAPESTPIYKVFACWYGGYGGSDSWKLNSGITKATFKVEEYSYYFEGSSGSVYECLQDCYGANMYGMSVLQNMIDKAGKNGVTIEIMPENTSWLGLNYE